MLRNGKWIPQGQNWVQFGTRITLHLSNIKLIVLIWISLKSIRITFAMGGGGPYEHPQSPLKKWDKAIIETQPSNLHFFMAEKDEVLRIAYAEKKRQPSVTHASMHSQSVDNFLAESDLPWCHEFSATQIKHQRSDIPGMQEEDTRMKGRSNTRRRERIGRKMPPRNGSWSHIFTPLISPVLSRSLLLWRPLHWRHWPFHTNSYRKKRNARSG